MLFFIVGYWFWLSRSWVSQHFFCAKTKQCLLSFCYLYVCVCILYSVSAVSCTSSYCHWLAALKASLCVCHCPAALWWPSRTAVRSISCGSGRPIHPVIHYAPGPSETRPARKTSLPRRHCHPTSPRPAEQGQHRWATRDDALPAASHLVAQAFSFLTMTRVAARAYFAAGLHFVPSVILHII